MNANSFARCVRLTSKEDFKHVFDHVEGRVSDKVFLILTSRNILTKSRLGLIVAKKHVNKATDRNRVKRYIRESFRLRQHELGFQDIIVLARKGVLEKSDSEMYSLLHSMWNQVQKKYCSSSKREIMRKKISYKQREEESLK